MVPHALCSNGHLRFLAIFSNLHRASLHLCFYVGTSDLHPVWNSSLRLRFASSCHVLHQRGLALLSIGEGGPSMVVEYIHQCWNDWTVHLRLFFLLLLPPKWNEWDAPVLFLLWVHVNCFIWVLPHAGKLWFPL